MKAIWYKLLAGIGLLWLTACASLPGQVTGKPVQTYVLTADKSAQLMAQGQGPILLVSPPQAWPGYGSSRIAYVKRPHEVNYYAYSEWADTPSRMIEPLLVRALEANGRFGAVLSASSGTLADLRLDTEIVSLQHEFYTTPSQGRVVIRAQLIRLTNPDVLGTHIFEATAPAVTDDPYGGIGAINQALKQVLNEIVAFCNQAIANVHSTSGPNVRLPSEVNNPNEDHTEDQPDDLNAGGGLLGYRFSRWRWGRRILMDIVS